MNSPLFIIYRERLPILLLFVFFFFGSLSIVSASYVGLNGHHVWRQSDSYSQILGFMGAKGITPMTNFFGQTRIYDLPIYEYIVAKISLLTVSHPLVVCKYVNIGFWLLLLISGGLIVEYFNPGANIFLWCLLTTSPLFLHYYATPVPDIMALSVSALGLALILRAGETETWQHTVVIAAFSFASLIKSPIPFVFLIFYGTYLVLHWPNKTTPRFLCVSGMIFLVPLIFACMAEIVRRTMLGVDVSGFAQDPNWYFGTLQQRYSGEFWLTMYVRVCESFPFHRIAFFVFPVVVVLYIAIGGSELRPLAPFVAAFFSGWLTFSNLYFIHDYYELPVTVVLFMFLSVCLRRIVVRGEMGWLGLGVAKIAGATLFDLSVIITLLATPAVMVFMNRISDYETASIYDAMSFALRASDELLFVPGSGYSPQNPSIGGLTTTRITLTSLAALETNCEAILSRAEAVLVQGLSSCLRLHKVSATTYFEDLGYQLYLNRKLSTK
jgi:hypothetical protein